MTNTYTDFVFMPGRGLYKGFTFSRPITWSQAHDILKERGVFGNLKPGGYGPGFYMLSVDSECIRDMKVCREFEQIEVGTP